MNDEKRVPKRIAQTLINSLKGGVVPRTGLPYITVGRKNEIEALLHDVDIVSEGGASFRFIVGKYGSGKSFLLQTIRNYVMDRGFIVADADLSPERRLQGTKGPRDRDLQPTESLSAICPQRQSRREEPLLYSLINGLTKFKRNVWRRVNSCREAVSCLWRWTKRFILPYQVFPNSCMDLSSEIFYQSITTPI